MILGIDYADDRYLRRLGSVLLRGYFDLPLGQRITRQLDSLVILTTNETRPLPEELLLSCVVLETHFPSIESLLSWAQAVFPKISLRVSETVAHLIMEDRDFAINRASRPPGIHDFLDILRATAAIGINEAEQLHFLKKMNTFTQQDRFRERVPVEVPESIIRIPAPVSKPELRDQTVFISYASSVEEDFVDRLHHSLCEEGINAKIDKIDLKYRESLGNYIEKLGEGSAIVVIVSDKYLRSPWCMWELLNIYKAKNFQDRVFPIVMGDAEITDGIGRLGYAEYWETRLRDFDAAMQKVDRLAISDSTVKEGRRIREFADKVDTLASMVADMNFRTMDEPTEEALKTLGASLVSRLNNLSNMDNEYEK